MAPNRIINGGRGAQSWQQMVANANTEREIVEVCRSYFASFTPDEIAQLPPACRPERMVDGNDVILYAISLAQHRDERWDQALLQRLRGFFMLASGRLSEIEASSSAANEADEA